MKTKPKIKTLALTAISVLAILFLFSSPGILVSAYTPQSSPTAVKGCKGSCVYVGDYVAGSGNISVINATSNRLLTTIRLPSGSGVFGVLYDSKANLILASNYGANALLEINPATDKIVKTIAVVSPAFMTMAGNGIVYIALFGQTAYQPFNVTSGKLGDTITACGVDPEFLDYNSVDGMIYAADRSSTSNGAGCIDVINPSTNTATSFNLGVTPVGVAVNQATGKVYVSDFNNTASIESVYVIKGTKLLATITSPKFDTARLWGVVYDPANKMIYVAATNNNTVIPINSKNVVGAPISVGTGPDYGCYVSTSKRLYISNTHETVPPAAVSVLSASNKVVKTIGLGKGSAGPYGCAEN